MAARQNSFQNTLQNLFKTMQLAKLASKTRQLYRIGTWTVLNLKRRTTLVKKLKRDLVQNHNTTTPKAKDNLILRLRSVDKFKRFRKRNNNASNTCHKWATFC